MKFARLGMSRNKHGVLARYDLELLFVKLRPRGDRYHQLRYVHSLIAHFPLLILSPSFTTIYYPIIKQTNYKTYGTRWFSSAFPRVI